MPPHGYAVLLCIIKLFYHSDAEVIVYAYIVQSSLDESSCVKEALFSSHLFSLFLRCASLWR